MTINLRHLLKNISRQVHPCQKFKCLKSDIFFSIKGTKCMWKETINFSLLLKIVSRKVIHCQKSSAFEIEYIFFNQREEMNVKEVHDSQFLSPFKKCIPTKSSCQTVSVFENEYTFFDQRKEMFVKEDYQFLSTFIKIYIPTSTSIPKSFSIWIWVHLFQSKEGNECEWIVWLSVFVTFWKMYPDK